MTELHTEALIDCSYSKKTQLKEDVLALDWAIQQGTQLGGLTYFRSDLPVKPLGLRQKRVYLSTCNLPLDVRAASRGHPLRSCIRNPDGSTKLEVCWSSRADPLFVVVDMDSSSWLAHVALFDCDRGGLAGFFDPCQYHRRHRHAVNAIERSGLSWAVAETHVMLVVCAPSIDNSGFLDAICCAAKEFFLNFGIDSPIFLDLYAKLSHQMHEGHPSPDFGTGDHQRRVFQWASECPLFRNRDIRDKRDGCFHVLDRAWGNMQWWGCWELVSKYMETTEDWLGWSNVMPVGRSSAGISDAIADGEGSVPPTGGASETERQSAAADDTPDTGADGAVVKDSIADIVNDLRLEYSNMLHMSSVIAGNDTLRSLMMLVCKITDPVRLVTLVSATRARSKKDTARWLWGQTRPQATRYLLQCFGAFEDDYFLRKIGIFQNIGIRSSWALKQRDADAVVEFAFAHCCELVMQEILFLMRFSHSFPGMFAGLLRNLLFSPRIVFLIVGLNSILVQEALNESILSSFAPDSVCACRCM